MKDQGILASDAEREATVSRLRAAHQEGRLTTDELVEREGYAYRARHSPVLEGLLRDLPKCVSLAPVQSKRRRWPQAACCLLVFGIGFGLTSLLIGGFHHHRSSSFLPTWPQQYETVMPRLQTKYRCLTLYDDNGNQQTRVPILAGAIQHDPPSIYWKTTRGFIGEGDRFNATLDTASCPKSKRGARH